MSVLSSLPPVHEQAERLVALGLDRLVGVDADELHRASDGAPPDALLAVHPRRAPASVLTGLLRWRDKAGFVVSDMTDVDEFTPIPESETPSTDVYLVTDLERGDAMSNWSPDEALPAIVGAGRTPLLLTEGIHWLLQRPDVLERNSCFMTIGSRRRKDARRLDARTPAIWISNGTGRDGAAHRDAPKVGWCWAGNRHTWLGFASASRRLPLPTAGAVGA